MVPSKAFKRFAFHCKNPYSLEQRFSNGAPGLEIF